MSGAAVILILYGLLGIVSTPTGGDGAPTNATYIVQTANGSLSAEQALGALSTGILKNTTTTGQLSIAVAGTDYQAADADLTTYAGITPSANVQSLLGAANYSAMRTQLTLVPGTDVQAFDADLTALAALSGTDTIYRRSASNTWSAVTINGDLRFSSGTLSAKRVMSCTIPGTLTTGSVSGANPKVGPIYIPAEYNGFDLVGVSAAARVGSTSGNPTFQVRRLRPTSATATTGANMLSTALTIDAAGTPEIDSSTAAAAAVIDTSNDDLATRDQLYIECSTAGTGTTDVVITLVLQLP